MKSKLTLFKKWKLLRNAMAMACTMMATTSMVGQYYDPSTDDPNYDANKTAGMQMQAPVMQDQLVRQLDVTQSYIDRNDRLTDDSRSVACAGNANWQEPSSPTNVPTNDDGSLMISIPFSFEFDGNTYTNVYINTNGNLTFSGPYSSYTSSGFPLSGNPMVAAFWADVDTRCSSCGVIDYQVYPNKLVVTWNNVGYYNRQSDKLNTFQIIISDGTDPSIPGNVQLNYCDMQWTTGSASDGSGGFGGSPARGGINSGNAGGQYFEEFTYSNASVSNLNGVTYNYNVSSSTIISPICQDYTVSLDASGNASIDASDIDNGSSAFAGIQSLSVAPSSFDCDDVGAPVTVTLTVTDNNGDTATCDAEVMVLTAPVVASCQDVTIYLDDSGNGSFIPEDANNGSTGCGTLTFSASQTMFDCTEIGTNLVTITVEDESGNTANCSATVHVFDNIPPTPLCELQVTTTLSSTNGKVVIEAFQMDNTSTDNCTDIPNLRYSYSATDVTDNSREYDCDDVGINEVSIWIWDESNNVSEECFSELEVIDNTAPTCMTNDVTVSLDASGNGSLTVAQVDNGTSDHCGIETLVLSRTTFDCSDIDYSGGIFNPISVDLIATDVNGNVATCPFNVTVIDEVGPEAMCQDVTLSLDASGNATLDPASMNNASTDVCGDLHPSTPFTASQTAFTCTSIGTNPVTLTVMDQYGNTSTCDANVIIEDNMAPVAVCEAITVELDASGNASIVAEDVDSGSTDNCGAPSLSIDINTFTCANLGPNSVVLTATDGSGNSNSCTATVTVVDDVDPTAVCQDINVYLDAAGNASIVAADVDGGSNDNCGTPTLSIDNNSFLCADVGVNDVTLTATDGSGNTHSCIANVTVLDTIKPTVICQDITVQLDASGAASITTSDIDNGSNDACGIETMSIDVTSFTCADVGANTVVLTVEDVNGNVETCSATVTVEDNVAPNALCQNATVMLDASGNGSITTADIDNGSSDACGIASMSLDMTDFDCTHVGLTNTVTLTVVDNNGNSSTCTADVTVIDEVNPVCSAKDITIQLHYSDGTATIQADSIDDGSSDACGIASYEIRREYTHFIWGTNYGSWGSSVDFNCEDLGVEPPGEVNVQLRVTDVNGNVSVCDAVVTVEDVDSPYLYCDDEVNVTLNNNGIGIINQNFVIVSSAWTVWDNCQIIPANISINGGTYQEYSCDDIGEDLMVTIEVSDNSGNVSTCMTSVNVLDKEDPECAAQDITVQLDDNGMASIVAADIDGGSTDNCSIVSWTLDKYDFTCDDVGAVTVTLTVEDQSGNTSQCDATVTVEDNVPPTMECQSITVQLDANGSVSITAADIDNGSNDACGIDNMYLDVYDFACANVGANTVTLTAVDVNGNSNTCTATVTVEDNVAPVVECTDATVYLEQSDEAPGQARVTPGELLANSLQIHGSNIHPYGQGAGDPSITEYTVSVTSAMTLDFMWYYASNNSSPVFDKFGYVVNGVVTLLSDDNGALVQSGTASVSLNPGDSFGFHMNSGDNAFGRAHGSVVGLELSGDLDESNWALSNTNSGDGYASINTSGAMVSDACGIASIEIDDYFFGCADYDTTIPVTVTVTDVNGNVSTCTSNVYVDDVQAPLAICQSITVQLDASGNVSIAEDDIDDGSADGCSVVSYDTDITDFTCTDIGANDVVLTVTDQAGNTATCSATVTVEDNVAPTAMCQDVTVQLDAAGNGSVTAAEVDNGSNDACGIASVALLETDTSYDCNDIGETIEVTLVVTDVNNNTSSCTANVTVEDNVDPIAVCQAVTVELDASGNGVLIPANLDGGSTDACGIDPNGYSASKTAFNCSDVGMEMVELTVTDNNGNTATCEATVTIVDNVPPVAECQDVTLYLDFSGSATLDAAQLDNGSNDACGLATNPFSADITSFGCAQVGANTVVLTVTDVNGNTSTCPSTVTIIDNVKPMVNCVNNVEVPLNGDGRGFVTKEEVLSAAFDACGIMDTVIIGDGQMGDTLYFDCADIGLVPVTIRVTDNNGNVEECNTEVNVKDEIAPVISCISMPTTIYLDANGEAVLDPVDLDDGTTDNCGPITFTASKTDYTCADFGINNVTLYATDGQGNPSSCNAMVIVADNIDPVASCQNITVQLDASGNASITAADLDAGSSDNCSVVSMSIDTEDFDCTMVGANTVTLTVTDQAGNTDSCPATVTVEDNVAPVAQCQSISVELDETGNATINPSDIDDGSSDACGIATLALDNDAFDCSNLGNNTVTLTVTDNNNNTAVCTATVEVLDYIAPEVECLSPTIALDATGNASIALSDVYGSSDDNCTVTSESYGPAAVNCEGIDMSGFTLLGDYNGKRYYQSNATMSWSDALADAIAHGGMLASIDDAAENGFIAGGISSNSWIAYSDRVEEGEFVWVDGNSSTYSNWNSGEPNDLGGEDNTEIFAGSGLWNDLPNTSTRTYVMETLIPGANQVSATVYVEDQSGNSAACMSLITIEDNTAPVAVCQAVTLQLDANGVVVLDPADLDGGSTDACGIDVTAYAASQTEFDCTHIGTNTVTLTVYDNNGNSSTCDATVTVEDNVLPIAECSAYTVQLDAMGNASIVAADVDGGSSDNCGIASMSVSPSDFTCSDIGANTVTLTVMDAEGNTATCTTTVTVEDNEAPTATCQAYTLALDATGNATLLPENVDDGSNDACGIASMTVSPNTFDCSHIGANTVTLTVEDSNGNTSTCSATVTVEDVTGPEITCPDNIEKFTLPSDCNQNVIMPPLAPSDVCTGSATYEYQAVGITFINTGVDVFALFPVGLTEVTAIATDGYNNTSTCSFFVEVIDNIDPVVSGCADIGDMTVPADAGTCGATVTWDESLINANDNCSGLGDGLELTSNYASGDVLPVGTTEVIYTATDEAGNTATCSFEVTVTPSAGAASFTYFDASLAVQFTDASTNAMSWSWDFGDGNSSTDQNPNHTYATGGTYTACLTITDACGDTDVYCEDVELVNSGLLCIDNVDFAVGWNLISFDVAPVDSSIAAVFGSHLGSDINYITAFDGMSLVYDPAAPLPMFNTLQEVERGYGYWVQCNNAFTLSVSGECIDPTYKTDLTTGWNLVAYVPQVPMAPAMYFSDLVAANALDYVSGFTPDDGTITYDPSAPLPMFNTLTQMENGYGYWVKVNQDVASPDWITSDDETEVRDDHTDDWGNKITASYDFIYGTIQGAQNGDLVDVYNEDRQLVGQLEVVADKYLMTLSIYGDDALTEEVDGLTYGEELSFMFNGILSDETIAFAGNMTIHTIDLDFRVVDVETPELEIEKVAMYPNPFVDQATITISTKVAGEYSMKLMDVAGALVLDRDLGKLAQGTNEIILERGDLPTGQYHVIVHNKDTNNVTRLKAIIIQ